MTEIMDDRPIPEIPIPSQLIVSLAAGPLVLGLRGLDGATQLLQEIGRASEEVFRGDRLPVLNVTPADASPPADDE